MQRVYVATAEAHDDEMRQKIHAHRTHRAADGWTTIEAPLALAEAVGTVSDDAALLVDCLTMWLSNVLLSGRDIEPACDALLGALAARRGPLVTVSNEVGQGVVPDTALGRRFRNAQGALNRRLAEQSDGVVAVMAGLPLALKGPLPTLAP